MQQRASLVKLLTFKGRPFLSMLCQVVVLASFRSGTKRGFHPRTASQQGLPHWAAASGSAHLHHSDTPLLPATVQQNFTLQPRTVAAAVRRTAGPHL